MKSKSKFLDSFAIPIPKEILSELKVFSKNSNNIDDVLISSLEKHINFDSLESPVKSMHKKRQEEREKMKTLDHYFEKTASPSEKVSSVSSPSKNQNGSSKNKHSTVDSANESDDSFVDSELSDSSDIIPCSQTVDEATIPLSASSKKSAMNFSTLSSHSPTADDSDSSDFVDEDLDSRESAQTSNAPDLNSCRTLVGESGVSDDEVETRNELVKTKKLSLKLKPSPSSKSKDSCDDSVLKEKNKEEKSSPRKSIFLSNISKGGESPGGSSKQAVDLLTENKRQEMPSPKPARKSIFSLNAMGQGLGLANISSSSRFSRAAASSSSSAEQISEKQSSQSKDGEEGLSEDFGDSSDDERAVATPSQEGARSKPVSEFNESSIFNPKAMSSFRRDAPTSAANETPGSAIQKKDGQNQRGHSTPLTTPLRTYRDNHNVSESEGSSKEEETLAQGQDESGDLDLNWNKKWLKDVTKNKVKYYLNGQEENSDALFLEDLSSDDEIYVVQCPNEVNVESLMKCHLDLLGLREVNLKTRQGKSLKCEANCVQQPMSKVSLLLPSKIGQEWKIRPVSVCGSVLISESYDLSESEVGSLSLVGVSDFGNDSGGGSDSEAESTITPLPKNIRLRHPIHGKDFENTPSPKIRSPKKKKKKKLEEIESPLSMGTVGRPVGVAIDDSTISVVTDDEMGPRKKKKKSKEIQLTDNESPPMEQTPEFKLPKLKKKKKKNNNESLDETLKHVHDNDGDDSTSNIMEENFVMDIDIKEHSIADQTSEVFKVPSEKSKKKKKKSILGSSSDSISSRGVAIDEKTVSLVSDDECYTKETKRKSKQARAEVHEEEEQVSELELSPTKKKKRKHKSKDLEGVENETGQELSVAAEPDSMHKTKKRKHQINAFDGLSEEAEDQPEVKKKKKQK